MSEKLNVGAEHSGAEKIDTSKESERNLKRLEEAAREAAQETSEELGTLEQRAKSEAVSGAELSPAEDETTHNDSSIYSHKELKANSYERGMERVRSNLSKPDRAFSRIVHAKAIDDASNFAAKTVARPSGFLGGAMLALLGSVVLTYLTRHYGFSYNYLFLVILFVGGFFAGLLIEAVTKIFKRR